MAKGPFLSQKAGRDAADKEDLRCECEEFGWAREWRW